MTSASGTVSIGIPLIFALTGGLSGAGTDSGTLRPWIYFALSQQSFEGRVR